MGLIYARSLSLVYGNVEGLSERNGGRASNVSENVIKRGFVEINGTQLCFEQLGTGPDLVFLHAGIADSRMWRGPALMMHHKYRTLNFDMRGYGQSELVKGTFSYHGDLDALFNHCDIERAVLIGCSFGSRIAVDFALEYPDSVAGLVLVSPVVSGMESSKEIERFDQAEESSLEAGDIEEAVELNIDMWVRGRDRDLEDIDPEFTQRVREMQRRAFELQLDTEGVKVDWLYPPAIERLDEVSCPALIVVGSHDHWDILEMGARLARELPNAKIVQMPNCAHLPSMERPEEFFNHVTEFVEKVV